MSSTTDVARSPLPEGVGQYAGMWVALRGGEVVAAAESFDELIANEAVRADDAFYRVPEAGASFY